MTQFSTDKSKTFIEHRRSIKAKMNATKGNLVILKKSSLVNKEEKEAIQLIINAYTNFNEVYNKWRNKNIPTYQKYLIDNKDTLPELILDEERFNFKYLKSDQEIDEIVKNSCDD